MNDSRWRVSVILKLIVPSIFAALTMLWSCSASAKRIVISIDGTDNAPSDGFDDFSLEGKLKDESISNVFKIHLFSGGSFPNPSPDTTDEAHVDQVSLYFIGVGNRDQYSPWKVFSRLGAKEESLFAKHDPKKIRGIAIEQLLAIYKPGDTLYLFGFSRGAAIARQLAQELSESGLDMGGTEPVIPSIRFMGLWDTVAAYGLPNTEEPSGETLGEGDSVHDNVKEVVHLLAIDEMRILFRPTLIGDREGVTEMWFPGVHSDIGGGYRIDGLSDITLKYMIDRAALAGLNIVKLKDARKNLLKTGIEVERLEVVPEAKADMHGPSSWKPSNLLKKREIRVLDNRSDSALPIVHSAILERKIDPLNYEPMNVVDSDITIYCAPSSIALDLCVN